LFKTRFVLAAVVALLGFTTSSAGAAQSSPFSWGQYPVADHTSGYIDTQGSWPSGPEEKWVVNPTPLCPWGDQSYVDWGGNGTIAAGETVLGDVCLISDYGYGSNVSTYNYPKQVAFRVTAPSNSLSISLSDDAGHSWAGPAPEPYGSGWRWQLCVQDKEAVGTTEASLPLYYSLIPESNGGYGRRLHFQLRIRNASSRSVRKTSATLEGRWNQAGTGPATELEGVPCPPRAPVP
jgi:hypothetical protein